MSGFFTLQAVGDSVRLLYINGKALRPLSIYQKSFNASDLMIAVCLGSLDTPH